MKGWRERAEEWMIRQGEKTTEEFFRKLLLVLTVVMIFVVVIGIITLIYIVFYVAPYYPAGGPEFRVEELVWDLLYI